ncbi:MAG: DUF502 domain-containing protein [Crocinitomicaceae bacterium]|nr:DUF502 domain-containing protein [Crocinitomicaceae bacterium]
MSNRSLKKIIGYILNGLLITLPIFATVYLIFKLFTWLDGLIPRLIYSKKDLEEFESTGHTFWGWGILSLLLILFLMGWIGSKVINEPLKRWFDRQLDRLPLIKTIYKSITDLLGAFVGSKKRFNQPVLVKLSYDPDLEAIGFVTDTDLSELGDIPDKVAVYFPMSYSFSGHLLLVPVKNITRIERNAVDVMKYIVSGGVVEIEHEVPREHGEK